MKAANCGGEDILTRTDGVAENLENWGDSASGNPMLTPQGAKDIDSNR